MNNIRTKKTPVEFQTFLIFFSITGIRTDLLTELLLNPNLDAKHYAIEPL